MDSGKPYTGVWIETMKSVNIDVKVDSVTPYMGVWIETLSIRHLNILFYVTPFMGVCIETTDNP